MIEDFISLGIDEGTAKKCEKLINAKLKDYVSVSEFEQAKSEIETLKGSLKERDLQLDELKNTDIDVNSLKETITKLQEENKLKEETHNNEIRQIKIDNAVEMAITNERGLNSKAIKALLDVQNFELLEDGSVKGLSEQMEKLVKADDSKFLFESKEKKAPVLKGASVGESGNDEGVGGGVDLKNMSYTEIVQAMESNPSLKLD